MKHKLENLLLLPKHKRKKKKRKKNNSKSNLRALKSSKNSFKTRYKEEKRIKK